MTDPNNAPAANDPADAEPERGLLIFDHPDGARHGWGDVDDPSVGGLLADDPEATPT